ncbi:hypothetical protein AOPFMNJM_1449 [Methylobacterium jeotgali]|uniref:LigA n=1 Tax=Methylobacterium jeotgali TaxID=381630 RepID=A0ABQ4SSR6_9HYPH|nr:hypothetical protein AOPFMNJM_1449 [Methylobacterium jeotgali]
MVGPQPLVRRRRLVGGGGLERAPGRSRRPGDRARRRSVAVPGLRLPAARRRGPPPRGSGLRFRLRSPGRDAVAGPTPRACLRPRPDDAFRGARPRRRRPGQCRRPGADPRPDRDGDPRPRSGAGPPGPRHGRPRRDPGRAVGRRSPGRRPRAGARSGPGGPPGAAALEIRAAARRRAGAVQGRGRGGPRGEGGGRRADRRRRHRLRAPLPCRRASARALRGADRRPPASRLGEPACRRRLLRQRGLRAAGPRPSRPAAAQGDRRGRCRRAGAERAEPPADGPGLRREGRHPGRPPRSGGDALRAGAGAGHQVEPRHRARRRHRPVHVRRVGPRRRRAGPQRHRHRAAERRARDGLSQGIALGGRLPREPAQACPLSWQEHRG